MIQQWDFPVDEPVSLTEWRVRRLSGKLPTIGARQARAETLRTLAAEYGISHEGLRRALARAGHETCRAPVTSAEPRRGRMHRAPGRGRSTALTPDDIREVCLRHGAGEGVRALARAFGVSHETIRRYLARSGESADRAATA